MCVWSLLKEEFIMMTGHFAWQPIGNQSVQQTHITQTNYKNASIVAKKK